MNLLESAACSAVSGNERASLSCRLARAGRRGALSLYDVHRSQNHVIQGSEIHTPLWSLFSYTLTTLNPQSNDLGPYSAPRVLQRSTAFFVILGKPRGRGCSYEAMSFYEIRAFVGDRVDVYRLA